MVHEQIGDILVITLPERLDAAGLAGVEAQFSALVAAHSGNVLVDMAQVAFLASLALRMLLMSLNAVRARGDDMRLCGAQPAVAEIFRKSRFDTLFSVYPDRAAGLSSYGVS